jgi:hypothetical protein
MDQVQMKTTEESPQPPTPGSLPQRLTQIDTISGKRTEPVGPEDEACEGLKPGDARLIWTLKLVSHDKKLHESSGDMLMGGHFSESHLPVAVRGFDNILKLSVMQPITADYMAFTSKHLKKGKKPNDRKSPWPGGS